MDTIDACIILIAADPDADDCLAAAEEAVVGASDGELAGWDLAPRWADEARERVALSVPAWALPRITAVLDSDVVTAQGRTNE